MSRASHWVLLGTVILAAYLCLVRSSQLRADAEPAGLVAIEPGAIGVLAPAGQAEVRSLDRVALVPPSLRQAGAAWFHGGVGLLSFATAWLLMVCVRRPATRWPTRLMAFSLAALAGALLWSLASRGGPHAVTSAAAAAVTSSLIPPLALALVLGLAVIVRRT